MMQQQTEYFDVVDDADNVLYQLPRDEVHAKGLLHRAVHGLLFTTDGQQVLLQQRADNKQHEPGCWDTSVSGHLHAGESYDAAMIRECHEELGLELTDTPQRLFKMDLRDGVDDEFVWVYRFASDAAVTPCRDELKDIRWFAIDDMLQFVVNETEPCSVTLKAIVNTLIEQNTFGNTQVL